MGAELADALRGCSKRITNPAGFKILINVNRSPVPQIPVNEDLISQLKEAMGRRYNSDIRVLDLSKFRNDSVLEEKGLYIALNRPVVFNAAIKIIKENIPELVGLNLSDNKLFNLEPMTSLSGTCTMLTALDLSKNTVSKADYHNVEKASFKTHFIS